MIRFVDRASLTVELRAMIALALPLIVAQAAAMGQGVIEVLLAGHYSAHVLAAVAVGSNVTSLALMAMIGILFVVPPSVAQLAGAGRHGEIGPLFRQVIWLALGVGLLALAAVRWGGPAIVAFAGVPAELAGDVDAYLRAVSLAVPAIGLFMAFRGLSDGLSLPIPTMVLAVGGLALLVPVGWVLMYGLVGLPPLGAAGTGYAAAMVDWLGIAIFAAWIRFGRSYRRVSLAPGRAGPDLKALADLLRVGLPMGVSIVLEVGLFTFATLAVGRLGDTATAAHQVALNVAAFAFMLPLGLSAAITVRVGRAVGRADPAALRRSVFAGFLLVLITQTFTSTVILTQHAAIAAIYTGDAAVLAGAAVLIKIAGVFQFVDGIQVTCNGVLRGLKDAHVPMLLTACAYWVVGVPLGLALTFPLGYGVAGMWGGLTAGLATAAILLLARVVLILRHSSLRPVAENRERPLTPADATESIA